MVTTQTADSVLKSYYLDTIAGQLNNQVNPFLTRIEKTSSDVWGKDVKKIVRYGVNGGLCAGLDGGFAPQAGNPTYGVFTASLKNLYGRIDISDKALRVASSNDGAFIDLLNDEIGALIKSARFNVGRMLFGDGTGKLATTTEVDSSHLDTMTLDSLKNIELGMIVDVVDTSNNLTVVTAATILDVDPETKKIKLSGKVANAAKTFELYVQNSKGNELTGLGALFGTSETLYGISRDSNAWLKPYKKEVTTLTENEVQRAIDEVESRSGSKINFIICSWGVRRALFEVLSQYRQTTSMELDGGFSAISFNGIPVVADRFCPDGTMYLLNTDDFALHQLCDWEFMQNENGAILSQVANKTVYTATLVKYCELLCSRPCGQAMLYGITEK